MIASINMAASILKSPHNPSIWEVEVKRATSLRPAWATQPEKGKERRGEEGWAKYTMPSDKSPAARPSQPAPPPPQPLDPVHGILNRKGENTTFGTVVLSAVVTSSSLLFL